MGDPEPWGDGVGEEPTREDGYPAGEGKAEVRLGKEEAGEESVE